MLRKTVKAALLAAAVSPALGLAQTTAPAPQPGTAPGASATTSPAAPTSPHTVTGNVGIFSQYIFRGLTQTDGDPALQGGFDYSHSSGLYLGTWGSNISFLKENASVNAVNSAAVLGAASTNNVIMGTYQQGGSLELDFYGGYKWSLPHGVTLDLGTLYYWYPGRTNEVYNTATRAGLPAGTTFGSAPKADTWEVYIAPSWKWLTAKFSYSVMDKTFGVLDSSGTWYLDVTANVPLGDFFKPLDGFTFLAHWGYQKYSGTDPRNAAFATTGSGGAFAPYTSTPSKDTLFSYKDVKIGLSYGLPMNFTVGAFWSKAYDYNKLGYGGVTDRVAGPGTAGSFYGPYPRDIAKSTGTIYVQKTF